MTDHDAITTRARPTCPPNVTAEVAAEFDRVIDQLGPGAQASDAYTVLMFADAWVRWRKATADVAAQGAVVMSGGTPCPHPALAVVHQAHGQLLRLAKALRLTVDSRRQPETHHAPRVQFGAGRRPRRLP